MSECEKAFREWAASPNRLFGLADAWRAAWEHQANHIAHLESQLADAEQREKSAKKVAQHFEDRLAELQTIVPVKCADCKCTFRVRNGEIAIEHPPEPPVQESGE